MLKDSTEMNICPHCNNEYKTASSLKGHITKSHKVIPAQTIKPAEFIKSIIDDLINNMTFETHVDTQDSEISFNLSEDSNDECDPETFDEEVFDNEPIY